MGCASSRPDEPVFTKEGKPEPTVDVDIPMLKEELKPAVMEVFNLFDTNGTKQIEIATLEQFGSMTIGPTQVPILKGMKDMDTNGDAKVDQHEWLMYFAVTAEALEADMSSFHSIVSDLKAVAEHAATIAACTKAAAVDFDVAPSDAEQSNDVIAHLESLILEGAKKDKVLELFKTWDFKGSGKIDRAVMMSKSVQVGPREEKVFAAFDLMDVNNDMVVTSEEMFDYFGVVASEMDDARFDELIEEMIAVATLERCVADSVKIAEQVHAETLAGATEADDEAAAAIPDLPTARKVVVEKLFATFADGAAQIDLDKVEGAKAGHIEIGPARDNVLKRLRDMDINSDGKVDTSEWELYFQVMSSETDEDTFTLLMEELQDSAEKLRALTMAERLK